MAIHGMQALQVKAGKDLVSLLVLPGTLVDNPCNMIGYSFFSLLSGVLRRKMFEDDLEVDRRVVMVDARKDAPGDRLGHLLSFFNEPIDANGVIILELDDHVLKEQSQVLGALSQQISGLV